MRFGNRHGAEKNVAWKLERYQYNDCALGSDRGVCGTGTMIRH